MRSTSVTDLSKGETGWVSYPSSIENIQLRGNLRLPANTSGTVPAMIIAHGSGGPDLRNERWAQFLLEHGIATFVVDYFGPRNIGPSSRFQPVPYHDAKDALALLATHPRIDRKRIGIIGFSRGANIAVQAANFEGFAAHIGLYPSCEAVGVNSRDSKAPVLILLGSRDELVSVFSCEHLADSARRYAGREVELKVYEGGHHAWDGDYSGSWYHAALGRAYRLESNREITAYSQEGVLRFLRTVFGMPGGGAQRRRSTSQVRCLHLSREDGLSQSDVCPSGVLISLDPSTRLRSARSGRARRAVSADALYACACRRHQRIPIASIAGPSA